MIDTIYVEESVREHPRARRLLRRYPRARTVTCDRYGEVFNPSAQSFRLQKRAPALILARKEGKLVHRAPPGFGIGDEHNFYFSHMLNCLYDCRYCFLQGMFRSAHYVLFVNYDDFERAIDETLKAEADSHCTFFSGYDCDSLALESITGFAAAFVPFFAARPETTLELRTKSVATHALAGARPAPNIIVAYSLTPAPAAKAVEHGAPPVDARIETMAALAMAGWRIGIRLDPLLWYDGWEADYRKLVGQLAARVPASAVHSISLGPLRFPRQMFHRLEAMYPAEPLFAGGMRRRGGLVSYGQAREAELAAAVEEMARQVYPAADVFSCTSISS